MSAIEVHNAYKTYSDGGTEVLNGFNMTVPQGVLYSLIGSSGCGKTTLLNCLVSLQNLDSGTIRIFGSTKTAEQLYRIGNMPQNISLYERLSIRENFLLFGNLSHNSNPNKTSNAKEICNYLEKRCEFLMDFLQLPPLDRIVDSLSGGQRRRVSLAVALINEPDMLLLDEPTCGVDPLVREKIWNHLRYLVKEKGTTVVLTTHYIDEAKHSDIVGVMRKGQLIAEEIPQVLTRRLRVSSLEEAFAALCRQQDDFAPYSSKSRESLSYCESLASDQKKHERQDWSHSFKRIAQLTRKNFWNLSRNKIMLLFCTIAPVLCILSICVATMSNIHGIPLGVVDYELDDISYCFQNSSAQDCEFESLSCVFIRELPTDVFTLESFKSVAEARAAVESGRTWGYVSFPRNFSTSIFDLLYVSQEELPAHVNNDRVWNNTKVSLSLDQSNTIIYAAILYNFYNTFEHAFKNGLESCGLSKSKGESPLQYGNPVVGQDSFNFLDFIAPGLTLCTIFIFPGAAALRFINERRQGTLDRCLASGARIWEILASYALAEFWFLPVQSILAVLLLHYGFSVGNLSSIVHSNSAIILVALATVSGVAGLSYGFLVGALCKEEAPTAVVLISTILPLVFVSGLFWPMEGMPVILQKVSKFLPVTLPAEAFRQVISRGEDVDQVVIWTGFGVSAIYTMVFATITGVLITRNKK